MIFLIWTNPRKGLVQKRVLQRDASEGETYYEAIPKTAILTFIYLSGIYVKDESAEPPILSLMGSDPTFFFVTYSTSLLTASIGLSKALKTGPCRILPEGRVLEKKRISLYLRVRSRWCQHASKAEANLSECMMSASECVMQASKCMKLASAS